jgi:uncharacterized membrane protein
MEVFAENGRPSNRGEPHLVSRSFCNKMVQSSSHIFGFNQAFASKLSAQANSELVLKMFPRFVRSVQVFTVLTLVFGPLLFLAMSDGPPNVFDFMSPWSIFIIIGAFIGITTFFVVFLLLTPTTKRLVRLILQMQQNPQQPPPAELHVLQKRMAIGAPLGVLLLLLAEVFMVAAAQF